MTVEIFEPAPIYEIQNTGPYNIPHPYRSESIRAAVIRDGEVMDLDPADFMVLPAAADEAGILNLGADIATEFEGARLTIWRETLEEQGWLGVLGEREKGLEIQLDRIVMALQEQREVGRRSLRSTGPIGPFEPVDGATLTFEAGQPVPGPTVTQIASAQAYAEAAQQAADTTTELMDLARDAMNISFASQAVLLDHEEAIPESAIIWVRREGTAFEVAPAAAADAHYVTVGGVKLYEAGPAFTTRARLAAALQRGTLTDGQVVMVAGFEAVIDASATGTASALHDLGEAGVRLMGRTIDARWFGVHDYHADAHLAIEAANTYAKAQKGGTNSVKLLLSGAVNLREPITLGGATALYHVDWSALTLNVTSGGSLEATGGWAVTIEAANSMIHCGRVNANKLSNGIRINNCDNSQIFSPNVRRYLNAGVIVTGNCAGARVEVPVTTEWLPSDPEYFINEAYIGYGFVADSADFVLTGGQCGWCWCALHITPAGHGFEAHGFHPYNGDVTSTAPRQHPFCVINEATGPALLYNCYIDNGYIDDRSGTLRIQGGWHLTLLDRVTLTQPYTRVRLPSPASNYTGSISDFDSSVGFYTGAWANDASNLIADMVNPPADQRGPSRRVEVGRRRTRMIPTSGDNIDDLTTKQGASGTVIRQRFYPGGDAADRLDVEIYAGRMRLLDLAGNGHIILSSSSRVGLTGNVNRLDVYTNNALRAIFPDNGGFRPATDNDQALGLGTARWSTVYAGTGTINTSDETQKQDIEPIPDAVLDAWAEVEFMQYRWRDRVLARGEQARVHFGVIAQRIEEVFLSHGLDPWRYGLLCLDAWDDMPAELDADGNLVAPARPAGRLYGVRMDQCLVLEVALARRNYSRKASHGQR